MNWRCFYSHNYKAKQTFQATFLVGDGNHKITEIIYHGYECTRCHDRMIKKNKSCSYDAPNATQQAYDWQNVEPGSENPTMIKVIQK